MLVRPSDFVARLLPHLQNRELSVHSAFERSVNLEAFAQVLITVTSPSLGRSPFGLAAERDLSPILPFLRRTGGVTYRDGRFWAAGKPVLTVAQLPPYSTGLVVEQSEPVVTAEAVHRLLSDLSTGEGRGLAELLPRWPCGIPLSAIVERVAPPSPWVAKAAASMSKFDRGEVDDLVDAARGLVGLGIGLTPSGDDFLLGFMGERLAQGHRKEAAALSKALSHRVMEMTPVVSASYLRHAFRGRFGSQLRHLIEVVHAPSADALSLRLTAERVITVGSTSGWDSLIGVLTALYRYQHEASPVPPA